MINLFIFTHKHMIPVKRQKEAHIFNLTKDFIKNLQTISLWMT